MNRVDLAFGFLGRLLKEGHRPKAVTFSPILKGLCRENRINEAAAMVFDTMPELGCVPDVFSYNILVKGFCSSRKTGIALHLLLKMVKAGGGCEPDVITYNTVLDGLCKEGELDKAFGLYNQMHNAGVIPDNVTYTSLIDGLCKKGAFDEAEELLNAMISKGYQLNVVTYMPSWTPGAKWEKPRRQKGCYMT